MRARVVLIASAIGLAGCSKPPKPQPVEKKAVAADAKAAGSKADARPTPPPLSKEDIRLIEADPATLSPEEKRKRAFALRRKIMQNPDSPAARTLTDLAKAAHEGAIDPHGGKGQTLHLPGTKANGGAPPAGYRPPKDEDATKTEGASKGEPASQPTP